MLHLDRVGDCVLATKHRCMYILLMPIIPYRFSRQSGTKRISLRTVPETPTHAQHQVSSFTFTIFKEFIILLLIIIKQTITLIRESFTDVQVLPHHLNYSDSQKLPVKIVQYVFINSCTNCYRTIHN